MNTYTENVIAILNQVKGFENITKEDCKMKRLGGMTNIVHLVEMPDINLIVRIPGKGTEDYINRTFEYNNAMAAWRAGVSAEILWADVSKGVMVSKAINEIETMTPDLFSKRKGSPSRAGVALSKLKVYSFKEAFIYSFIRLIIGPLVGFSFIKIFNLSGVEAGVMFIQASMPSAVLTYLVSEIYSPKKISNNVASTVALSTFLSFFTLIVVVFISLKYFN